MKLLSNFELQTTLALAGVAPASPYATSIADRTYALPTLNFLGGAFSTALWSFQQFFEVLRWTPEANDCDDFARIAAGFAQMLHYLTPNRPPATALAVGELWYVKDSGEGHAINVALCGPSPDGVVFYEPQTRQLVKLTDTELARVTIVRF